MAGSATVSYAGLFKDASALSGKLKGATTQVLSVSDAAGKANIVLGAIIEALKVGAAAVDAIIANARERRTQGLAASGAGTTAQKIDLLARRFEAMGLSGADADKSLDEFSKTIDSSIDDTGKGPDELTKLGLSAVGDDGQRFDKATLLMRVQEKLADLYKQNDEMRAKIAADKAAGKSVNQAALDELNANEKLASKASRKFGFDNKQIGGLRQSGGGANLIRETNKANARRPPVDPAIDALNDKIAKSADEIDQMVGRIGDGLLGTGTKILAPLMGPVEAGFENAVDVGGRRAAANAAAALKGIEDVNNLPNKVPGMFTYTRDAVRKAKEQAEAQLKAYEKWKQDTGEQAGPNLFGTLSPQTAKPGPSPFGGLGTWTNGKWNDVPAKAAGTDVSRTFGLSGPVTTRAGDDNSVTIYRIGVTTGPNAPAIASGVVDAIQRANLAKSTQLATTGVTSK